MKVEHASSPAGHRIQHILEKTDIVDYQLKNRQEDQIRYKAGVTEKPVNFPGV